MIPARTLRCSSQTIGLGRRRLESSSARPFSSSSVHNSHIRSSPLLTKNASPILRTLPRIRLSKTNLIIRNGAGIRFASTTPLTTATPIITTPSTSSPPVPNPELATSLNDVTDVSFDHLSSMPEHIGYLKSLGLDYGWGPTAMMEWTLEHIHVLAGTPWWVSIVLTAIAARGVLLKAYLGASDTSARMAAVKHITDPLTKQMRDAQKNRDTEAMMMARQEISEINRKAGIKVYKAFVPMLQVFTGYGTWKLLRGMSLLPVPGFEDGGVLWFYNLAIPDPYFVLPLGTAALLHWTLRKGGETGASTLSAQATKAIAIIMPVLSFAFTFWLPAAVQLSFCVTSMFSFCQMTLLQKPSFRERLGLYPLPVKSTPTPPPYKGLQVKGLTQKEINSAIKPPVTPAVTPRGPGIKNFVASKVDQGLTTITSVTHAGKDFVGKRKKDMEDLIGQDEKREAKAYETKRKSEILEQKQVRLALNAERRKRRTLELNEATKKRAARKQSEKM